MNPTDKFNMAKQTKRLMATILDKDDRASFKANMIQAQLQGAIKPTKEKRESK